MSPPEAKFTGIPTSIKAGTFVNFSDNSTNNPTAWQWYFPGGSPSSSTLKNPTNIIYNSAGLYDVTLKVSNIGGSDSLTKSNYINVGNTGIFDFNKSSFVNIYPNPATNNLIIENQSTESKVLSISIMNTIGEEVLKGKINITSLYNVDISSFPTGFYILSLQHENEIYLSKIIIQR